MMPPKTASVAYSEPPLRATAHRTKDGKLLRNWEPASHAIRQIWRNIQMQLEHESNNGLVTNNVNMGQQRDSASAKDIPIRNTSTASDTASVFDIHSVSENDATSDSGYTPVPGSEDVIDTESDSDDTNSRHDQNKVLDGDTFRRMIDYDEPTGDNGASNEEYNDETDDKCHCFVAAIDQGIITVDMVVDVVRSLNGPAASIALADLVAIVNHVCADVVSGVKSFQALCEDEHFIHTTGQDPKRFRAEMKSLLQFLGTFDIHVTGQEKRFYRQLRACASVWDDSPALLQFMRTQSFGGGTWDEFRKWKGTYSKAFDVSATIGDMFFMTTKAAVKRIGESDVRGNKEMKLTDIKKYRSWWAHSYPYCMGEITAAELRKAGVVYGPNFVPVATAAKGAGNLPVETNKKLRKEIDSAVEIARYHMRWRPDGMKHADEYAQRWKSEMAETATSRENNVVTEIAIESALAVGMRAVRVLCPERPGTGVQEKREISGRLWQTMTTFVTDLSSHQSRLEVWIRHTSMDNKCFYLLACINMFKEVEMRHLDMFQRYRAEFNALKTLLDLFIHPGDDDDIDSVFSTARLAIRTLWDEHDQIGKAYARDEHYHAVRTLHDEHHAAPLQAQNGNQHVRQDEEDEASIHSEKGARDTRVSLEQHEDMTFHTEQDTADIPRAQEYEEDISQSEKGEGGNRLRSTHTADASIQHEDDNECNRLEERENGKEEEAMAHSGREGKDTLMRTDDDAEIMSQEDDENEDGRQEQEREATVSQSEKDRGDTHMQRAQETEAVAHSGGGIKDVVQRTEYEEETRSPAQDNTDDTQVAPEREGMATCHSKDAANETSGNIEEKATLHAGHDMDDIEVEREDDINHRVNSDTGDTQMWTEDVEEDETQAATTAQEEQDDRAAEQREARAADEIHQVQTILSANVWRRNSDPQPTNIWSEGGDKLKLTADPTQFTPPTPYTIPLAKSASSSCNTRTDIVNVVLERASISDTAKDLSQLGLDDDDDDDPFINRNDKPGTGGGHHSNEVGEVIALTPTKRILNTPNNKCTPHKRRKAQIRGDEVEKGRQRLFAAEETRNAILAERDGLVVEMTKVQGGMTSTDTHNLTELLDRTDHELNIAVDEEKRIQDRIEELERQLKYERAKLSDVVKRKEGWTRIATLKKDMGDVDFRLAAAVAECVCISQDVEKIKQETGWTNPDANAESDDESDRQE